jgi:hypothetical protein
MATAKTTQVTPATFPCRADGCKEPNLAPTHKDGLCKIHRDAYKAGTFRITAQTPVAARAYRRSVTCACGRVLADADVTEAGPSGWRNRSSTENGDWVFHEKESRDDLLASALVAGRQDLELCTCEWAAVAL